MKKMIMAASAAVMAAAMAPAAHATDVVCDDIVGSAVCTFNEGQGAGFLGNTIGAGVSFSDSFDIILSDSYLLTLTASQALGATNFSALTAELFQGGSSLGLVTIDALANNFNLGAGTYTLVVAGKANASGAAAYTFNVGIAAVPEPATWAMMVAGIAAVGVTLRRRSAVRVAFS